MVAGSDAVLAPSPRRRPMPAPATVSHPPHDTARRVSTHERARAHEGQDGPPQADPDPGPEPEKKDPPRPPPCEREFLCMTPLHTALCWWAFVLYSVDMHIREIGEIPCGIKLAKSAGVFIWFGCMGCGTAGLSERLLWAVVKFMTAGAIGLGTPDDAR